jgi:hypothetical protein
MSVAEVLRYGQDLESKSVSELRQVIHAINQPTNERFRQIT